MTNKTHESFAIEPLSEEKLSQEIARLLRNEPTAYFDSNFRNARQPFNILFDAWDAADSARDTVFGSALALLIDKSIYREEKWPDSALMQLMAALQRGNGEVIECLEIHLKKMSISGPSTDRERLVLAGILKGLWVLRGAFSGKAWSSYGKQLGEKYSDLIVGALLATGRRQALESLPYFLNHWRRARIAFASRMHQLIIDWSSTQFNLFYSSLQGKMDLENVNELNGFIEQLCVELPAKDIPESVHDSCGWADVLRPSVKTAFQSAP